MSAPLHVSTLSVKKKGLRGREALMQGVRRLLRACRTSINQLAIWENIACEHHFYVPICPLSVSMLPVSMLFVCHYLWPRSEKCCM